MKVVPIFGNSLAGKSFAVTRQRRLNCYLESRQDGDKENIACFGTPGLVQLFSLPSVARGILGTQKGLYAVSSGTFYALTSSGSVIFSTKINSSSGIVSMAVNPTQVLIVDGLFGYIYTPPNLVRVTSSGFPNGANTVAFVGGFFVCEQPGTQQFWASNAFDGLTWDALAFASASQYSDNIVAVDALSGNLVVFSERHLEFWQNVGTTPMPFQPIQSAVSEYGLASIAGRCHIDNSIVFLARNAQGTTQICRVQGFAVSVISTPDLDFVMRQFSTVSDATALSYVHDGHPMAEITFPTANRSFLYDCLTGLWSETQTGVTTAYAQRHIGALSTYCAGQTYITDYSTGAVYTLNGAAYTDNGQTIPREIITRHASQDNNVFSVDEVYLDMETGVGLPSGQGSAPQLSIEVSKDNGRTFGTPIIGYLGALGSYLSRVIWRRFGSARDFVFRIRMTDPVKFVVMGGAIVTRERAQ